MIDYQHIFHTGVRVPDVDAAMSELGGQLGVTWSTVQHSLDREVWTPQRGLEQVELTFVYSCEGPQHIELLCGGAGSVWDGSESPGAHHVGVWTDDVIGNVERCVSAGWTVAAAAAAPDDGYGAFAYVVPPAGFIVELVTSWARPAFEQWWAGGRLGTERDR